MVLLVEACYHHEDAPPRYESLQGLPQDTPKPRSILRKSRSPRRRRPPTRRPAALWAGVGSNRRSSGPSAATQTSAAVSRVSWATATGASFLTVRAAAPAPERFSGGFAAAAHRALQETGFGALVVIRAGWTGPRCDFCHCSQMRPRAARNAFVALCVTESSLETNRTRRFTVTRGCSQRGGCSASQ